MTSTAKPPSHDNKLPLVFEDTAQKWLIYENRVLCVGSMHPIDFRAMVEFYADNAGAADNILAGIDYFDTYARWFCLLELLKRRKQKQHTLTLYDSREQAEKAMGRAA